MEIKTTLFSSSPPFLPICLVETGSFYLKHQWCNNINHRNLCSTPARRAQKFFRILSQDSRNGYAHGCWCLPDWFWFWPQKFSFQDHVVFELIFFFRWEDKRSTKCRENFCWIPYKGFSTFCCRLLIFHLPKCLICYRVKNWQTSEWYLPIKGIVRINNSYEYSTSWIDQSW